MEDQAAVQDEIRVLQSQQRRQRREIFDVEDGIEARRDALIAALERRLNQRSHSVRLFRIRWRLDQGSTCRIINYLQSDSGCAEIPPSRLPGALMAAKSTTTLRNLRNTRDFRAELLSIAAHLADNTETALIQVEEPAISHATVRDEWIRLIAAIKPEIAARMHLELSQSARSAAPTGMLSSRSRMHRSELIPLDRPNFRAEVLRLLVGASLANDGMWSVKGLIQRIGASQTPIRQALQELKRSGVLHEWSGSHIDLASEDLSAELLAKLQAIPQTLRFRFERGARIRTPAELLERALPLLGPKAKGAWTRVALSGVAVAQLEVPALDLVGIPRVDLVAFVPRDAKTFDAHAMRKLSDGLEYEPNVLATASVVVTLVRADEREMRSNVIEGVRCAPAMDVFLALIDMNLRQQAAKYAKAVRA